MIPIALFLLFLTRPSSPHNPLPGYVQFTWARPRLPLAEEDFDMKMEISGDVGKGAQSLPTSATCFFRLTLSPHLESKEQLESSLRLAIEHGDLDGDTGVSVDRSVFQGL